MADLHTRKWGPGEGTVNYELETCRLSKGRTGRLKAAPGIQGEEKGPGHRVRAEQIFVKKVNM